MNRKTLMMAKAHVLQRLQKRLKTADDTPEVLLENMVDALCLDCIDFRLMLDGSKSVLLDAVSKDLDVLDKFLGLVEEDLQQLIEEEEDKSDAPDAQ